MSFSNIPSSSPPTYIPTPVITQLPLYQHGTMPNTNNNDKSTNDLKNLMKDNQEMLKAIKESLRSKNYQENKKKFNDNNSTSSESSNDENNHFNNVHQKKIKHSKDVNGNNINNVKTHQFTKCC